MSKDFEILKYTHDKHPASHLHEYYEIFISLSNDGKLFIREKDYALQFGRVFILTPLEIHRCFCHGNQDYDRYIIHFPTERLQDLSTANTNLTELYGNASMIHQLHGDVLANILGQLIAIEKINVNEFGQDVERNIKFDMFLLTMARVISEHSVTGIQTPDSTSYVYVKDVLQYIHDHYDQDITLEVLSKHFFMSKSRLSQIFKSATGFSIGDYIITYRIKQACSLLKRGVNVQDVGKMVGFHTSTHFIRMFKKRVGCSPGRFLKGIKASDE